MAVSMTEVTHREQNYFSLLPSVHSKKKEAAPKMNVVSILLLRRLQKPGSMLCYSTRSLKRSVTLLPAAGMRKHDRLLTGTSQLCVWEDNTLQKCRHCSTHVSVYHRPGGFSSNLCRSSYARFLAFQGTEMQLT